MSVFIFAAISSKISFFCTRPRISRSLYYHRRFQDPSFKQFYFLHFFHLHPLYSLPYASPLTPLHPQIQLSAHSSTASTVCRASHKMCFSPPPAAPPAATHKRPPRYSPSNSLMPPPFLSRKAAGFFHPPDSAFSRDTLMPPGLPPASPQRPYRS